MPIVSHAVEYSGGRYVVRATDQDGKGHMVSFPRDAMTDADVTAKVAAMVAAIDSSLAQAEFELIVGAG